MTKLSKKSTKSNLNLVSISAFRDSLNLLTKRDDSGYSNCLQDILGEFSGLTFDDIYNKHFLIREMGQVRVIKLRIQNTELGSSSAAGYRLIIICNKKYDHIAMLNIYPKKGKYSRLDLTKGEYKNLLNTYGKELKNGSLLSFPSK